uniref:Uncharacterized protein n=1 Tax=Strigamia maritima TaxID=126957 RepID=T1JAV6_STRMM
MASKEVSPLVSPTPDTEHTCIICNEKYRQPRVLPCLHVFCEDCLDKLIYNEDHDRILSNVICCPDCKQETKISNKGAIGFPIDYITCNLMDKVAIENMQIVCTSCKAKEKAVARCSDCANYLCPNCVTAHQYMRCFENHKVVSFEDMKKADDSDDDESGVEIHKPIFCPIHANESMKYFCHSCQVPVCNECLVLEHEQPEHHYERISHIEQKQREELQNLMVESKSKVHFCEEASVALESTLRDLQTQHDNVRSSIDETYQSYKAILEKRKENLLTELEELHTNQELAIMETFHGVEKTIEKIEDACKFTQRLLKHGDIIEVLSLKRIVGSQLLYLINNTPKPEVNICLEFMSDPEKFEDSVKMTFGYFKKDQQSKDSNQMSPMHSSFESEGFVLPSGVLSSDSTNAADLTPSSVSDFNLAHLASLADRSRDSHSPTTLTIADIITSAAGDTLCPTSSHLNALNNLSALAKLGSVSLGSQGLSSQLLLNGQMVSGLDGLPSPQSRSTVSPPPSQTQGLRGVSSQSPLDHAALGALLNGSLQSLSSASSPTLIRGGSPHMDSNHLLNGSSMGHLNGGLSGTTISSLLAATSAMNSFNQSAFAAPRSATAKLNPMQIRCKFGQLGPGKGQFNSPHGFCLGIEEDIIVADTNNHRIQVFEKTGEFKYQFGIPGKEEGQLWYPRKVAVMRTSGKFVVCDRGNERSRMQIFTKNGHFIKKIAIRYIDIVAGLAITNQGHIVAVDSVSPTVFVISESGDLLRWFDCSDYMREPSDIAISGKEFFVCDFKGHCVVVFSEDGQFLRRIGCENITNYPNGIDISDAGDVLVGDSHGNRFHVAVFSRDGSLLSEFECPYVKVSRCCGLKITSEGFVVTLAKNNHHVLVLNTLYII